jgi:hypothetical protein
MYNCGLCRKNPQTAKDRGCQEEGFQNLRKPRRVDPSGQDYFFCPGKATWHDEIAELFQQCRVATETAILPKQGSLEDQDELFYECFPDFVVKWKDKTYHKIWSDVHAFTKVVLESIFGKKK